MSKTVKGGQFEIFLTSILLLNFKNLKRDLKNFAKKMRIFNSLIVPKNLKEGTLWDFFNIRSVAKYQKKNEGRNLL